MSLLRSFVTAFSMFSRLPVPTLQWRDANMRYMLAMFPFVGAAVGLFVWGWLWISAALGFGVILTAAGLTLLPITVTGGIHLDGFCDTVDAIASRAPQERKREILKDPHTGAFAVIGVIAYLILTFALFTELQISPLTPLVLGLLFILSRTLSGLSVLLFSANAGKGLVHIFKESASKIISVMILTLFFILCIAGLIFINLLTGCAVAVVSIVCVIYLFFMSRRQFGGMSGDLAGYFLQLCELLTLASVILVQKVVSL